MHGAPPYPAVLAGSVSYGADCTTLQIASGDGAIRPLSCPTGETTQFSTRYGQQGYSSPAILQWPPTGKAFFWLSDHGSLWLMSWSGEPRQVAQDVAMAVWHATGERLSFTRLSHDARATTTTLFQVTGSQSPRLLLTVPGWIQFDAGPSGIWYGAEGQLWLVPYGQEVAGPVGPLPAAAPGTRIHLSPDEQRVAYSCQATEPGLLDLCVQGEDVAQRFELGARELSLAWRPDGQILAVGYQRHQPWGGFDEPAWITFIGQQGAEDETVQQRFQVAPQGMVGTIAWLPEAGQLLVQTYPYTGRRMILLDRRTATIVDLSQPRWDATVALHPDGETLLLHNGRGGFWRSQLPSGGTSR